MENDFTGLNAAQKAAVETISGPLLVLAGAGTGKTRVIIYRIAHLLKNWIAPENILALTFTNKAAREMRERVRQLVDEERASKIFLGTFHAFCIRVLRKEVKSTDLHSGFTIADDVDQKSILKQAVAELNLTNFEIDLNVFQSIISKAKNKLIFPEKYKSTARGLIPEKVAAVYQKYQEILHLQNMVDFDDLLLKTVQLWEDNTDILEEYRDRYRYLFVDEFQDTNYVQFKIVELLGGSRKNICVVGDNEQSIYGWRGANVENIFDFPNKFSGTKVVKLEQNYRSTNTILKAANSFIAGNANQKYRKALWSKNGEGDKIKQHQVESDVNEAKFVPNEIYRIMLNDSSAQYKDIALLYRSNHQSRLFEQQFRKDNIPHRLVGARSFYERREIRDAVAYLKLVANPRDDQSFLRIIGVPARGLGKKAIENLRDIQARKHLPLCLLLNNEKFLSNISGKAKNSAVDFYSVYKKWSQEFKELGNIAMKAKSYLFDVGFLNCFQKMFKNIDEAEMRKDNVLELINAIAQYENDLDKGAKLIDFLESFSLSDDNDKVEEDEGNNNAVTLMTVHAAKGLEFHYVFVVGMEQGIFPHSRALEERDDDEERRLFYVAITRAKRALNSDSLKRKISLWQQVQTTPF